MREVVKTLPARSPNCAALLTSTAKAATDRGRKVKGTIHWVALQAVDAEVRPTIVLHRPEPDAAGDFNNISTRTR
jgi:hypothetical protein